MGGDVCDPSERAISRRTQDSQRTTGIRAAQDREVPFNSRCSFQRLRESCRKDTKRTRVRSDRNAAPCSRPTTNVIEMEARKLRFELSTETYLLIVVRSDRNFN